MQRGYWEKVLGIKEYLLCGTCEQKFQVNETYVRDLLYGNLPPPLQKLLIGSTVSLGVSEFKPDGLLGARKATVDYKKLKLFQLSILCEPELRKVIF